MPFSEGKTLAPWELWAGVRLLNSILTMKHTGCRLGQTGAASGLASYSGNGYGQCLHLPVSSSTKWDHITAHSSPGDTEDERSTRPFRRQWFPAGAATVSFKLGHREPHSSRWMEPFLWQE